MTQDVTAILAEELHKIAPDVDLEDVDRDGDLREEFDIDSMDFLNLVTALGKRLGREMPEVDYGEMGTFNDLAAYMARS